MQLVFSILYKFEMFQKILFSPENPNFVLYMIQNGVGHPGLPTKDETSELFLSFLLQSGFLVGQNGLFLWLIIT